MLQRLNNGVIIEDTIMKKMRNTVARLAIMRKGGVHDKSNKAKRQEHKQKLAKQIRTNNLGPYSFQDIKTYLKYSTL